MAYRGGATSISRTKPARAAAPGSTLTKSRSSRRSKGSPSSLGEGAAAYGSEMSGTEFTAEEYEAAEALTIMPEIQAALTLVNMKNVVYADIYVAVDENYVPPRTGGKRKLRGGETETAAALKKLTKDTLELGKEAGSALDSAFATVVTNATFKNLLTTYATVNFIQNPYLFVDLVQTLRGTWAQWVPVAVNNAGYSGILSQMLQAAGYAGKFLITDQANYIQESPVYAFLLLSTAAAYVRYLAAQESTPQEPVTAMDYLTARAKYAIALLGMAYTTGKEAVEMYVTKPEAPENKKVRLLKQLREATAIVPKSKIKFEGVGPAAVPGLMIQVPSPAVLTADAAKRLAETVSKLVVVLPDTDAANILAAMAAAAPAAAPGAPEGMDEELGGGRRRRKTKKRAIKRRRITRRMTMPRFTY
jgi:hypothetical protein